jgi:hypothetical protein
MGIRGTKLKSPRTALQTSPGAADGDSSSEKEGENNRRANFPSSQFALIGVIE